jgi:hypothetical protein
MSASLLQNLKSSLPGRLLLLAVGMLIGWLLVLPLAYSVGGATGTGAALVAVVLCLIGGELGLLIAAAFRGPAAAMHGLMLGLLARMAMPLLVGATLHVKVPALADAGMVFYLIAFYMVGLACETWLILSTIEPSLAPPMGARS